MSIPLSVPLEFAAKLQVPSWAHLRRGLELEIILAREVWQLACDAGAGESLATQIVGLGEHVARSTLLQRLSDHRSTLSDRYWLFICLAWVFETENTDRGFMLVEELYAAFDYPPEIEAFVPYMPMVGPDLGSKAANKARMRDTWSRFLGTEREFFADAREPDAP